VSAAVDLSTVTAETVAVVEARTLQRLTDVNFTFEPTNRYLQVSPKRSWPVGGFVWVGVRGYDKGIRTAVMPPDVVGKPVVASLAYNLLKREGMPGVPVLTCGADPTMPATIDPNCEYYRLLAQRSANDAATRGSLARLEVLRQATNMLGGWTLLEMLGGIPKAEAAILWGFPIHSAPVIDINPLAGVVPTVVGPNQIRLAVNGELNPATVGAFRIAEQEGSVYLLDLAALGQGRVGAGFPPIVASYAAGAITITTEAPLARGGLYGIAVTKSAQDLAGRAMVSPPISVLLMARGPVASADGKSLVSAASDLEAAQLEAGRQQLAALLNDPQLPGITGLSRATIAYLFAFAVPQ
jgi:hypothetical protein